MTIRHPNFGEYAKETAYKPYCIHGSTGCHRRYPGSVVATPNREQWDSGSRLRTSKRSSFGARTGGRGRSVVRSWDGTWKGREFAKGPL